MNNIFKPHQRPKGQGLPKEEEREVSFDGEDKKNDNSMGADKPSSVDVGHAEWMRSLASRNKYKRKEQGNYGQEEAQLSAAQRAEDVSVGHNSSHRQEQPEDGLYKEEENIAPKPTLSIGRNKEFGQDGGAARAYWLWLLLGSFSVLLIAVVALRFFDKNDTEAAGFDKPFIALENVEWKVRPQDPGGAEIPFENLEIMDTTGNARLLQNQVDLLLPSASEDDVESYENKTEQNLQDQVANLLDMAGDSEDALYGEDAMQTALAETNQDRGMQIAKRVEVPSDIPLIDGGISVWQVQLSTVFSEKDARAEWQRFARRYGNLVLEQPALISRIGDNYMLRIGSFETSRKANELCERIKMAGGDCLLYSPR